MRRRGVGVGRTGAGAAKKKTDAYNKKANELKTTSVQSAMQTVQTLETKLEAFAKKHQHDIQTDPAFRSRFLQMCGPLGVDPLQASHDDKRQGFWHKVGLGDALAGFYHELAVKTAEVCIATRSRNGGIVSVGEVKKILGARGTKFKLGGASSGASSDADKYSEEDIITAVNKLSKLGSGFRVVQVGKVSMIVSVPTELDSDHMELMRIASLENQEESRSGNVRGCVTMKEVRLATEWSEERTRRALHLLLAEGMAWLDLHKGVERYWFPSLWKEGLQGM